MKVTFKTWVAAAGVSLVLSAGVLQFKEAERAGAVAEQAKKSNGAAITVTRKIVWRTIKGKRVKMADYDVAGAGTGGVDGRYVDTDVYNSKPRYKFGASQYIRYTGTEWIIAVSATGDVPNGFWQYHVASAAATPPASGWAASFGGSNPAPTVTPVTPPATNSAGAFMAFARR